MKSELRQALARLPFEEKIRKVGELIQLSRKVKAQRIADESTSETRLSFASRGSLRGTKAKEVFVSERQRERGL